MTSRLNELKRMTKHNLLNPIEQPARQSDKGLEKIKSAGQLVTLLRSSLSYLPIFHIIIAKVAS